MGRGAGGGRPAPCLRRQTPEHQRPENTLSFRRMISAAQSSSQIPGRISEPEGRPGIPYLLRRHPQPQAGLSSEQQPNQTGGQRRAGPGSGLPQWGGANPEGQGGLGVPSSAEAARNPPEAPAALCPGGRCC